MGDNVDEAKCITWGEHTFWFITATHFTNSPLLATATTGTEEVALSIMANNEPDIQEHV